MSKFFKIVSVILVVAMLIPTAFAAEKEEAVPYASAFISSTSTYLYDVEGDTFGVWFSVTGNYTMDVIGASSIVIQRSRTGTGSWDNMKTFYPSSYSQMLKYNSVHHGASVTYTGTPDYYYRAYVTYYAEKNGNIGELGFYTEIMQL